MAKKILLADDSITIQKVVELTFSDGDFEVIAVNNGAKALQKLQEMRPDIILSDIIMPEKNGYEVCEFVKSHPDYKTIPIILLTGTFEPFDPDRAERAGADAVVTKPFESQSLIQKVEELIQAAAPAQISPVAAASAPSPFDETMNDRRSELSPEAARQDETPESDPFSDSPAPAPPAPEPFFQSRPEPAPPSPERFFNPAPEPAPSSPSFSFEPGVSPFGESPAAPQPPAPPTFTPPPSPPSESMETTAFPKMNFADLQRLRDEDQRAQESAAKPEPSSWSSETTAMPSPSSDDFRETPDEPVETPASLPWDTAPKEPESEPLEWPRAAPDPETGGADPFSATADEDRAPGGFGFDSAPAEQEGIPFEPAKYDPEPEPETPAPAFGEISWNRPTSAPESEEEEKAAAPEREPEPERFTPPASSFDASEQEPAAAAAADSPSAQPASSGALTTEQLDHIARRVVELLSEKAVRDIAWEVIPDLAQSIVRERIKELESDE